MLQEGATCKEPRATVKQRECGSESRGPVGVKKAMKNVGYPF